MSEQELIKKIELANKQMLEYEVQMDSYRKKFTSAETEYLAFKIEKQKLIEELRVLRARQGI